MANKTTKAIKAKPPKAEPPKVEEPSTPNCLQIDERYVQKGDKAKYQDVPQATFGKAMIARALSQPEVRAARTIQRYEGESLDVNATADELRELVADVQGGSMKRPEAMLVAQAHALDALFSALAMRSHTNSREGHLEASDRYLRLALKAQAQAVRTIEALGELKNPRQVTFVRQTNLANNQQVNNHSAQAEENPKPAKQTISGATYELLPDSRASGIESATHPAMATLETINRATHRGRQGQGIQKRI